MAGSLNDKIAIVTGASRGIGRAIVELFTREGARVWFSWSRNAKAASEVEESCPGATGIHVDSRDREAIDRHVDDILTMTGRIDILVNNAAISPSGFLAMTPPDQWESVMDVNLGGYYNWVRATIRPMMATKRGNIINIASISGLYGLPGQTAYGASKGAIMAFTRALAAEVGPKGIRVNSLVPGFVNTDMTAMIPSPTRRQYRDRILLGRFGDPAEIASVARFLASDEASYITGQALVVDGGLTTTMI